MVYGLSWFTACGIFPDQGSNLCLPHWQAHSLQLKQQKHRQTWKHILYKIYIYIFYKYFSHFVAYCLILLAGRACHRMEVLILMKTNINF